VAEALGPAEAALFPARSVAVPDASVIPREPTPVIADNVTVRELPLPLTPTVALAEPVPFTVMSPVANVTEEAPPYVTEKVTELPPAAVSDTDGAPIVTEGAVVSTVTASPEDVELVFPAASVAVAVNVCVPSASEVPV